MKSVSLTQDVTQFNQVLVELVLPTLVDGFRRLEILIKSLKYFKSLPISTCYRINEIESNDVALLF